MTMKTIGPTTDAGCPRDAVPAGPCAGRQPAAGRLRLHGDESGTISILSVFAVMVLAMLLGMVMNVGRNTDGKLRMQNAADAAAYSGGVVIARGMNTLAFTNHMLCDIFALTSFLREAEARHSAAEAQKVLAAWSKVAPIFQGSGFPKFSTLGSSITQKVQMEQQMIDAYSEWASAVADRQLPLMEQILSEEAIPRYQRAVVQAFPNIAQLAASEIARRNGDPDHGRGPMFGALWRVNGFLVGGTLESTEQSSLPAVDPAARGPGDDYFKLAQTQRNNMANTYLNILNSQAMTGFDRVAKMSQFSALWRSFTCGELKRLTDDEYPDRNLPMELRMPAGVSPGTAAVKIPAGTRLEEIENQYLFVGVTYWSKLPEILPGLFRNPMDNDAIAYAEVQVYIPRRRLIWYWHGSGGGTSSGPATGGVPGEFPNLPSDEPTTPTAGGGGGYWDIGRQSVPTSWDLWNQSWTCQLVPAAGTSYVSRNGLSQVLQTAPLLPDGSGVDMKLPNLGGADDEQIRKISPH